MRESYRTGKALSKLLFGNNLARCALLAFGVAGCGGDAGAAPAPEPCADATPVALAAGEAVVLDALGAGACVRLPAAGAEGAQHLVVLLSGAGTQVPTGLSGPYQVTSGAGGAGALRSAAGLAGGTAAEELHLALRRREAALAAVAPRLAPPPDARLLLPPELGSRRDFQVCANTSCTATTTVAATARYVGRRGAIYLDDEVPAGGLTPDEVAQLGTLFDDWLYPVDTAAFGAPGDVDGNGVVTVLLSDAVNALSGDCAGGRLILGYFFGGDLLDVPGSNRGEVLHALVPDPSRPACGATRERVLRQLPPVLIHELQHLINYHRRVLAGGGTTEDVWLNEGLSHFAEELGARQIPNGPVQGDAPTRATQFFRGDLQNAYDYLSATESSFLVTPGSSLGTAAERGANWLFVRWLADHYADGDPLGAPLTRALAGATTTGAASVAAATGRPFDELAAWWQLANYLDNLPGFAPGDARLGYATLDLRASLAQLFPAYPLRPAELAAEEVRSGVLRAGSGRHWLVTQGAGGGARLLSVGGGSAPLALTLEPRVAIARIR